MNEQTIKCVNCNQLTTIYNTGPDNEQYCEDCYSGLWCCCDVCGVVVEQDTTTPFDDKMFCEDCFSDLINCDRCDNLCYPEDSRYSELADQHYCEGCYSDLFYYCEGCETECWRENIDADGYCETCSESDESIHDYDYKPDVEFYGKTGSLYFGLEIEVENVAGRVYNNDTAENLPEFTYAKADGSIEDGFEIVSHPATWEWLREHKKEWADTLEYLRKNGYRSYDTSTCGMHIHLSKKAFSTLHLYKFLKLVYENPEFVTKISRRSKYNLSKWASIAIDERLIYKAKKGDCKERYTAVNLQNDNTIELRIFRGTLSPQGFWINLEFCKSTYDYTAVAGISAISVQDYIDYVKTNYRDYPNLYQFVMQNYSVKG